MWIIGTSISYAHYKWPPDVLKCSLFPSPTLLGIVGFVLIAIIQGKKKLFTRHNEARLKASGQVWNFENMIYFSQNVSHRNGSLHTQNLPLEGGHNFPEDKLVNCYLPTTLAVQDCWGYWSRNLETLSSNPVLGLKLAGWLGPVIPSQS